MDDARLLAETFYAKFFGARYGMFAAVSIYGFQDSPSYKAEPNTVEDDKGEGLPVGHV